ncbi:MAG: hypothetical protein A2005_05585 [Desulfuromonadales bacterium GWC2_61_20]|nr:MAG: hypothetical protein A2005_05585 [Desulfuromonadales bacterium GWC2_61_20]
MEPYYTIMKLPGEKKEEYILLLPFTPSKRDNLAAWLTARCDEPNYGKLHAYTFPRDRLVYGPKQVDARINQDAEISPQLTLWNQRGTEVIRGSKDATASVYPQLKSTQPQLAKEAKAIFEKAISLQRQGDWAGYGEAIKKLEQVLQRMAQ